MTASNLSSAFAPLLGGLILAALLLCLPGSYAIAQAGSSDYTRDLPSVELVKAKINGTDENDTLARQAAVFNYLMEYTQTIKEARDYRGFYTPGEIRARTVYSQAAYQIEQDYKKTHSPADLANWSRLEGRYEINNALNWIHQLSGAQANAAYAQAQRVFHASEKRMYDNQMKENAEAQQRSQAAQNAVASNGTSNAPSAVAIRRCLELGGSQLECLANGLSTSARGLTAMFLGSLSQAPYTGLTLTGGFKSGNGVGAAFEDTTVGFSNCGKLIIDSRGYTIQRNGSQILIHIRNSPSPFTLVLGSDGSLQGPASAEFAGKVITGYKNVWVPAASSPGYYQTQQQTTNEDLSSLEAGQYAGSSNLSNAGEGTYNLSTTTTSSTYVPGSSSGGHWVQDPIYAPKTQACSIGTLIPGRPVAAAGSDGSLSAAANAAAGMLFGQPANIAGSAGEEVLAPGIRMAGLYSSRGGLKAQFSDSAVILDCGEAHVLDKYSVERTGNGILVHIQNSASPFTVTVEPDGSLAGPASVTAAGRLVSGMSGINVSFTPHTESCSLGTFTPAGSASATRGPTDPAASDQPVPAAAAVIPATPVTRPSMPSSEAPVRVSFRVLIYAKFAGTDPLAGQHVYVMREPMDEALREIGLPIPAGMTPGKAVAGLAAACRTQDCKAIYAALGRYFITSTVFDGAGKTTLSAHAMTGRYYFYATARTGNRALVWDVAANLAAGDNTVTLTAANAETLGQ